MDSKPNSDGQVAILRVTLPSRLVYFEDGKNADNTPKLIEATLPSRVFYSEPPPSHATVSKRTAGLAVEGGAVVKDVTGQQPENTGSPRLSSAVRSLNAKGKLLPR